MNRALALAVFAAAAIAVGAAPKGQTDHGTIKGSATTRDGGFGLVDLVDSNDAGRYDGGRPFNGFALGKPLTAKGDLSAEEIKGVVKAHHGEINACYAALLARTPKGAAQPKGTAMLQFEVSPEGKVATAAIAPGGLDEAKFVACVVEHVQQWVFPPPRGGGSVKVAYPVKLLPPD